MSTFTCHLRFDQFQFVLIHGPNIPGSYAILLLTALDLASITRHIHNWVLFLLWLYLFILFGVISPLFSSSILGHLPTWGVLLLVSYLFAFSYCSWDSQGKNTEVVLSELSAMTCLSWVTLRSMAHSFIELDKVVVHVISLVSFPWLWLSFCLPSDG